jgi:CelD/BcsL family acetyltransferase involved in cellulose biosynthesis
MVVELYTQADMWDTLQLEWNPLLERSISPVMFLTWEWLRTWWSSFGQGKELRVVGLRGADNKLLGIAPLFVQTSYIDPVADLPDIHVEKPNTSGQAVRTLHLVGGTEVSDYLDVLSPADSCVDLWTGTLNILADQRDWSILDLHGLPAASPTLTVVEDLARKLGWRVQRVDEDVCPVVALPDSWDEYLSTCLNKKQRHELRRKMRRAEQEARVEWSWANDPAGLDEGLAAFFALHRASHPDKQTFMDERMEGYFRALASATAAAGWLRLSLLRFNDQPVASYLCFDYSGQRLVYNSGFDLSSYAELAPGIVLLGYLITDAIRQGLRCFDFLQGNERYKYEFGAVDTHVDRLLIRR